MPNPRSEHSYSRPVRGQIAIRAAFWLALATTFCAAIAVSASLFVLRLDISNTRSFPGTLKVRQSSQPLVLPAGVPMGNIVVAEQRAVRAGQTIAAFDRADLSRHLQRAKRAVLVAQTQREWLLDRGAAPPDPTLGTVIDAESASQTKAALQECNAALDDAQARITRIEQSMTLLSHRLKLIDRKTELGFQAAAPGKPGLKDARAALDAALDRNKVAQQLQALAAQRDLARQDARRSVNIKVQDLTDAIQDARDLAALLEKFIARPRLTAPQDGTLGRIRPLQAGQVFDTPTQFADLALADNEHVDISFQAKGSQTILFEQGEDVLVEIPGAPDGNTVSATISDIRQGGEENGERRILVIATVNLEDRNVDLLPADTPGFPGPQTRTGMIRTEANVSVRIPDPVVSTIVQRGLLAHLPDLGHGWSRAFASWMG